MAQKDTILILTNSYGEGHRQAALALQGVLLTEKSEINTIVFDLSGNLDPSLLSLSKHAFIEGVKRFPKMYNYFYNKTRFDNSLSSFLKWFVSLNGNKILQRINQIDPVMIICTDPVSTSTVNSLKERGSVSCPVTAVLTDYGAHSLWVGNYIDFYIVGAHAVRKDLIKLGISKSRIKVTGIPIQPKFSQNFNREQLVKKYGLSKYLPTLLITGGGYGLLDKDLSVKRILREVPIPVQIIIVCGHNRKLYEQLMSEQYDYKHRVHVKGYVKDFAELMAISDAMLTKAGGLTITEAITMHLPIVLYHSIGGQESENERYLLENHLVAKGNTNDLFIQINNILTDTKLREELENNMAIHAYQESAFQAAQVILDWLQVNEQYSIQPSARRISVLPSH